MNMRFVFCCAAVGCVVVLVFVCSGCSGSSSKTPLAEAGANDATRPAEATVDAGVPGPFDAGAEAGSDAGGEGCHPGNVSGYRPPAYVGASTVSLACDGFNVEGGLVQSYGDACLGHAATYATCAAFAVPDAAGAAGCYGCLVTTESPDASTYGAVVVATIPVVNYNGCIQMVDPSEAGVSCAHALSAAYGCYEYACKAACPITDETSRAAFVTCANEAASGACAGYTLPGQACLTAEQGDGGTSVATICFAGTTAEDHYFSVAHHFCGGH
jgi:hypothetical protein